MKWNVIVKDLSTGRISPYNIFDCADFRIAVEKLISQKYDKTHFLEELDREADYCFRAQIEWETFFTTWPPYIGAEEISRIIKEFYLNRNKVSLCRNAPKSISKPSTELMYMLNSVPTGSDLRIICGRRGKNEETYKTCLERLQLSVCRTGPPGV